MTLAMKRARFSEEQIVGILKEHEAGRKIAELSREHGISEATLYGWKSKYGGVGVGGGRGSAAAAESGRREPPVEATGGRSQPGQRSAQGDRAKKRVELAGLRADAGVGGGI